MIGGLSSLSVSLRRRARINGRLFSSSGLEKREFSFLGGD